MSAPGCKKSSSSRGVIIYERNAKECEKLEKNKKKLEQEVVNLRSHIEMNMIEHSQVEQYKWEIEERVRQDLIEKLKEVNLFLQVNLFICHVLEFISL